MKKEIVLGRQGSGKARTEMGGGGGDEKGVAHMAAVPAWAHLVANTL